MITKAQGILSSTSQPKESSVAGACPEPVEGFLCTTIHKNFRGLRRIIPRDTNPQILRFPRFLRVVLLVAAMPRCVAKVFVTTRYAVGYRFIPSIMEISR
jgi:hypothetical protein